MINVLPTNIGYSDPKNRLFPLSQLHLRANDPFDVLVANFTTIVLNGSLYGMGYSAGYKYTVLRTIQQLFFCVRCKLSLV